MSDTQSLTMHDLPEEGEGTDNTSKACAANRKATQHDVLAMKIGTDRWMLGIQKGVDVYLWFGAIRKSTLEGEQKTFEVFDAAPHAIRFRDEHWEQWEKDRDTLIAVIGI